MTPNPTLPNSQSPVARLLNAARGGGLVLVSPAEGLNPHSFSVGTGHAPVGSLLGALLLTLGGEDETGRRYAEIVVHTAGPQDGEGQLDRPESELVRVSGSEIVFGAEWRCQSYRAAAALAAGSPPPADSKPSKLKALRQARGSGGAGSSDPGYASIDRTVHGVEYPQRVAGLRALITTLEARPHRTLLVLDLAVLDYPRPERAPADHTEITDVGIRTMRWLRDWAESRPASLLDVVLYTRNRARADALVTTGLPRLPAGAHISAGQQVALSPGRVTRIDWQWGAYPYGEDFAGDAAFRACDDDEEGGDSAAAQRAGHTLPQLLHGGVAGRPVRLSISTARPVPPDLKRRSGLIDRRFWAAVDIETLELALGREYYGAAHSPAVVGLIAALRSLRSAAQAEPDPQRFHDTAMPLWNRASTLMFWGEGGTGKTYFGKVLCRLLFGHEACLFRSNECGPSTRGRAMSFDNRFFGVAPPWEGCDAASEVGRHLHDTSGYTVLIIDEVATIVPGDFTACTQPLYTVLDERRFEGKNPSVIGGGSVSLWNTIIILTANLPSFPPPDVGPEHRRAVSRRMLPTEQALLTDAQVVDCARWHLARRIETSLQGVAVTRCSGLDREIAALRLQGRTPADLENELAPRAERAVEAMRAARVTAQNAPLLLDVTPFVAAALK